MTVFGKQKRSFNAKYYNEFKWIEYSIEKNAVFFAFVVEYLEVVLLIMFLLKVVLQIGKE